jgi:D-arabinose 1-dehydrogenase-like Zn-dependent alcohol dehydrogenase
MKAAFKRATAAIDDAALQQNLEQRLTQLKSQGRFVLNGYKLESMVDCMTTAAHIKHGAYSAENNKDAL